MKFLLVAGGTMPIPPTGWGAVEKVMWEQKTFLESRGHTVDIYNVKRHKAIRNVLARPWQYDLVHVHIDSLSRRWLPLSRRFRFPLLVTTHYGYAAFPDRWNAAYGKTVEIMRPLPDLIALSPEIQATLTTQGFTGRIHVLPNAVRCGDFTFAPAASKPALILGKIEERKKQRFLAETLAAYPTVACDLIGPTGRDDESDPGNGKNVVYRGPWTRREVETRLTEYASLVLLSDGEAHALVVLEAMAAGLSLIVSREASHNLDPSLPWVHIVDRDRPDEIAAAIESATRDNAHYRAEIRRYCEATFDWSVLGPGYVTLAQQVIATQRPRRKPR